MRSTGSNARTLTIHHVAGTGEQGYSGDGGQARSAKLARAQRSRLVAALLYVADTENHVIRAIDLETGIIRTVLGTGQRGDGPETRSAPMRAVPAARASWWTAAACCSSATARRTASGPSLRGADSIGGRESAGAARDRSRLPGPAYLRRVPVLPDLLAVPPTCPPHWARLRSRQFPVGHRRLIGERRHDDRRLADVVHVEAVVGVHVGVVGADVVVAVVLNRVEARNAGVGEAQMIGGADRLADVAPRADALQRLQPAIEDRPRPLPGSAGTSRRSGRCRCRCCSRRRTCRGRRRWPGRPGAR